MEIPGLEERLGGLEDAKSGLILELEKGRINFADRGNWDMLPRAEGGITETTRSWKYAWSNKIIDYFSSIGAPLSEQFAGNLYRKLNKDVMKKIVYGILSFPNIPLVIYERLTDWEKLCFAAGVYKIEGMRDMKYRPIAEIIRAYIKEGIDYLHKVHAVKKGHGQYETLLKIPGSQNYQKIDAAEDKENNELAAEFSRLLRAEKMFPVYERSERVAIFLDGCTEEQLKSLTRRFGAQQLKGYAVPPLA